MTGSEEARTADSQALLDAVVAIGSDLDLHSVLDRIVESACRLTDARYGALGVVDQHGGLSDFITWGVTEQEHRAIGSLPRGHGILGLLIQEPHPLRLSHLTDHPASYGFPPEHPRMDAFLGVPVRIRGTVFGNLYLTEKAGGADFTERDETLVTALANAAGYVIENARAFARSELRRQWLEASTQVLEELQPPIGPEEALRLVAAGARRVTGGPVAAVVGRREQGHVVLAADGAGTPPVEQVVAAVAQHVAEAEHDQRPVVVPHAEVGAVVVVPLRAHLAVSGALLVTLGAGRGQPEAEEAELLASFADQVSLALDRVQALVEREELLLVADRDRIARDLHDLVIQRLFATGLQLQGARRLAQSDDVRARIDATVADLDVTIRDIRSTIFRLQHRDDTSLRAGLHAVVQEYTPVLGFAPSLQVSGPVDTAVPEPLAAHLLAVLREALSNVARHARATGATVEVTARDGRVDLRVSDDGVGLPSDRHESGLRNVRRRAAEHDGAVRFLPREPHGTVVEWSVPL